MTARRIAGYGATSDGRRSTGAENSSATARKVTIVADDAVANSRRRTETRDTAPIAVRPVADGEAIHNRDRCLAAVEIESSAAALTVDNAVVRPVLRLQRYRLVAKVEVFVVRPHIRAVTHNDCVKPATGNRVQCGLNVCEVLASVLVYIVFGSERRSRCEDRQYCQNQEGE